ncbi:YhgE/Pip domain protein [Rothia dentocariosa ATCC 17931]|uniref:YhgE/Pip domain protein n=1 Tax=Rothia dentocariosa (strain ATCC 17931 / CDC X599 / XDIA) TaxID=762948 RepID=E3H1J3_ROTDC|nr:MULTISPECIES: YhgE/Pip domain-containing protein [Rothia]ADP40120.1 YhgE/Pip domain protein [Rothia dentocariosa ATCC 17931]OFN45500.1 ABC transporter [Rothia sp. HMSC071F11]WMS31000.1 YhgE/Pip domain-containing protein [Rothia dentocariosa]SUE36981.1 YhgE/Pip C-terminal domain [Rothia dentocariosa]
MSVFRVALVELKRLTSGVLPVLVLLAMSCIPLLYGSLYLYGNWDAYGNVNGIVGALVVEDEGAKDASGNDLNTGADVKKSLLDAGTFDWKSVETRDKAVQGVSDGTYDFALVIPKDFSARLVSTGSFKPDEKGNTGPINPQAAGLEIITNDANNYVLTNIVTKAGTAVRDSVASKVGDKTANTLLASFTTIHGKMNEAADGADKINANTVKLSDAMTQLADGTGTLNDGAVKLADGSEQLVDGSSRLIEGQNKLADGSSQLADGAGTLNQGAGKVNDGAIKLADGSSTLANGASDAHNGASQLADGSAALANGTGSLKKGANDLAQGAQQVADGTHSLKNALDQDGVRQLPGTLTAMCQNLNSIDTSAPSGDFGTDLSNTVVSKVAEDTRQKLAPLVESGSISQETADAIVANINSEQTKSAVASANDQVLKNHLAQHGQAGSDVLAKLQTLKNDNCVATGESAAAQKLSTLIDGVDKLDSGATAVAQGAGTLRDGITKLDSGATTLADGSAKLADGTGKVADGASTLNNGAAQLADGTGELKNGTGNLHNGAQQLADGEKEALDGQNKLHEGATTLQDGSSQLADGTGKLNSSTGQIADGTGQLKDGTGQLSTGLQNGTRQIPNLNEEQQKDVASVMSSPVDLEHSSLANGRNYGEGMGPFFMCLALWIGGLMLVQTLRPLNNRALASKAPTARIILGSWLPFGLIGIAQAVLMFAAVKFGLGFQMAHPWLAFLFLCFVATIFTLFIHGVVVFFGSPGKLIALIIMILQLITAGGTMPYETLPHAMRWMHDFFPMGYAVTGMRRLSYGINESSLMPIMMYLLLWGAVGLVLGYLGTRRDRIWSLKKLIPEITV